MTKGSRGVSRSTASRSCGCDTRPARYEQLAYRGGLLRAVRDVRRLPFVPGLVASLANGTRKVARESRPDVIHAHWWLPSGLAALAARPRTLVVTLHGSDVGLLAKPGVAPVGRMVASRARFVAAVSDALLEEARGPLRLDATRSGVVPMPIVVDAARGRSPHPCGPPVAGDRDRPCVAREGVRRAAGSAGPSPCRRR